MDTHHSEMKDVQLEDQEDDLFHAITEYENKKGKESETKHDEPHDGDDGDDDEMKAWLLMKKKASTQKKAEWDRGVTKGRAFFAEIIQPWMDMEVQLHDLGTDGLTESELEGIEETDKEQEEVEKHIEEMEADEQIEELEKCERDFMEYISGEEDRELVENCDKLQRKWEEEQINNLKIINKSIMEELGKKEEEDDTDLDCPEDEFMQIVNKMCEREELNKKVESREEEEEYIKNRDADMLSEYDDNVFLYDYVENIKGNINTGDAPGTSAQISTGTANLSPAKRRRKRGATHYTQKKRRTVPPYYAMPGSVGIFRTNIELSNIIFHLHFFQTMFSTNRQHFYFREWDVVVTVERKRVEEERSRMALIQESGSKYVPNMYMCEIFFKKKN